jgi:hypothetical protein
VTEDASLDQFATSDTEDDEPESEASAADESPTAEPETADGPAASPDEDASEDSEVSGDGDAITADASEGDVTASDDDSLDPDDVSPAVSTFDWTPDDGECAACGESVERRWRADGQKDGELVCGDCKEW